jgi:hypothetical protein
MELEKDWKPASQYCIYIQSKIRGKPHGNDLTAANQTLISAIGEHERWTDDGAIPEHYNRRLGVLWSSNRYVYATRNNRCPFEIGRKNTYALRVRGDSMKDANILDGDVVVIEQSQMAENGEKVVVRINQHEVTLKTLRLDQDGVKLIPANSTMSPIILNNADVEVLGIVRGVIRDRV